MESFLKRTWAEVHLDRAERNFEILNGMTDNAFTRPACVIKANAYGHGDAELMNCMQNAGADFFAVSNLREAVSLREAGCRGDILILGWTAPEYADILAEKNIIQAAVSLSHARELSEASRQKPVRVHIKLDTGMGRIGLLAADTGKCASEIAEIYHMSGLEAEGIFTHFASADSYEQASRDYTEMQKRRFFSAVEKAEAMGVKFREIHCLNSAGAILHYDRRSTLARYGIVLYGLKPDTGMEIPAGIEPVMELKSVVSYIKRLHKGESVSYGRTFTAEREMIAATIPAGYADGYPRLLSGKNTVLINGHRARGIGRICMDQTMADITDIPGVRVGDTVTLFGKDGGEFISADRLADSYGTIGYELVCGISPRVPRVYMRCGEIVSVRQIL